MNSSPLWLCRCIGAVLTAAAGLLMVSNFKYPSFKEVDLRGKVPFIVILVGSDGLCGNYH